MSKNLSTTPYYQLPNRQEFFKFLEQQSNNRDPASQVMWSANWRNEPSTLPFILECSNRFRGPNGSFHIIFDQGVIIGCGGVYRSAFDSSLCLAGTRTWLDSKYRNHSIMRDFLLPTHKEWAIKNNCKGIALCFNDYNKNIIETFKRIRLGESSTRINDRTPEHLFYSGLHEVPFSVNVQHTEQWLIYEKLDSKWDFDWRSIKFQP